MQAGHAPKAGSTRGERSAGALNRELVPRKRRTDMRTRDAMPRECRHRLRIRIDDAFTSVIAAVS
jgi:hypothetical protein